MSPLESLLLTQCQAVGLPTPEREVRFHPKRRWRFDLAWPVPQLAVEIEGGTWVNGRHSRGRGFEADCEKQAEALLAGWSLLRVTEGMVRDGRAVQLIERALERLWGVGQGEAVLPYPPQQTGSSNSSSRRYSANQHRETKL